MACMPKKNALGLDFFILCCNHIFCKSLFAKKYVFIFSTTTTTVTWFEKKIKSQIFFFHQYTIFSNFSPLVHITNYCIPGDLHFRFPIRESSILIRVFVRHQFRPLIAMDYPELSSKGHRCAVSGSIVQLGNVRLSRRHFRFRSDLIFWVPNVAGELLSLSCFHRNLYIKIRQYY